MWVVGWCKCCVLFVIGWYACLCLCCSFLLLFAVRLFSYVSFEMCCALLLVALLLAVCNVLRVCYLSRIVCCWLLCVVVGCCSMLMFCGALFVRFYCSVLAVGSR